MSVDPVRLAEAWLKPQTWRTVLVRVVSLLTIMLVIIPLITGDPRGIIAVHTPAWWIRLGAAVVLLLFSFSYEWLLVRAIRRKGPEAMARKFDLDWRKLTGPRWVRRVTLVGIMMGLGIGIPVGTLLALFIPGADLPATGRVGVLLLFVAATVAWTLPAAFGIRFLTLRYYRSFTRSD